jgi:hypothetical protein
MKRTTGFLLACILPVVLYILTASRTLPWGDGAEFYVAVRNLGIPHPSGYPLFLLLGRILHVLSGTPFLLNLLPGLFTLCACIFLYRIILHFTKAPFVSLALSLFFAVGRTAWYQSIAAEVYTLNLCLFCALLYCVIQALRDERYAVPAYFIAGLALTNHLTAILYIIPCGLYLLIERKKTVRFLPVALLPLLMYLYFPIRTRANPVPDLFNPETFEGLIAYVSGSAFLYRSFSIARSSFITDITVFLRSWWLQCLVLLPLGFYGLFKLREKRLRIMLMIIALVVLVYTLLYHIPDKQGYYLPFYAVWFIFCGSALVTILPERFRPLLLALPLVGTAVNYRACDLSKERSLDDLGNAIFESLPDTCIFVSDDYFVYYDLLNRAQSSTKHVIPVVQFYLRMDWYIEHLVQHYPDLVVPTSVEYRIKDCDRQLADSPRSHHGEISKVTCLLVQHEIAKANIGSREVFYFIYDDAHWPGRSGDLFLHYHGLYYEYRRDSTPPELFDLDVPAPAAYRTSVFTHTDALFVAKKFAAAFNRRGIYRSLYSDFEGAINDMRMALQYYPDYYQVHVNLGIALLNTGDTTQALEQWEIFLERSPSGPQRDRIQAWYDMLCY